MTTDADRLHTIAHALRRRGYTQLADGCTFAAATGDEGAAEVVAVLQSALATADPAPVSPAVLRARRQAALELRSLVGVAAFAGSDEALELNLRGSEWVGVTERIADLTRVLAAPPAAAPPLIVIPEPAVPVGSGWPDLTVPEWRVLVELSRRTSPSPSSAMRVNDLRGGGARGVVATFGAKQVPLIVGRLRTAGLVARTRGTAARVHVTAAGVAAARRYQQATREKTG